MRLARLARFILLATGFAVPAWLGAPLAAWAQNPPIIIGAAIALSGPQAPIDEGPFKAMQIAVDEVNAHGGLLGRSLKLISADTKSDISYGATAAQYVIDKGASMVVVSCDYDFGSAAANIANAKGLITFSACAADPKFGPRGIGANAYTMATSTVGEATVMAEWAHANGFKSAYLLLQTDTAFDSSWAENFKKRWIALGGPESFYGEDTFAGEDPQISTQITRLKSLRKAPDVVVLCAWAPAGVSAIRQLRAANVTQPILGSDSWDGDFWLSGVPNLSHMFIVTYASIYGTDPRPRVRNFFTVFKARYSTLPTQSNAVTGYSVIEAWVRAVERAKSFDTAKVRAELDAFKAEPFLAGPTSYTPQEHINSSRDMVVMEIVGGKQGKVVGVFAPHELPK
jgi:branched-chain amino acid transport system substrate-binding protein